MHAAQLLEEDEKADSWLSSRRQSRQPACWTAGYLSRRSCFVVITSAAASSMLRRDCFQVALTASSFCRLAFSVTRLAVHFLKAFSTAMIIAVFSLRGMAC